MNLHFFFLYLKYFSNFATSCDFKFFTKRVCVKNVQNRLKIIHDIISPSF